MAPSGIPSFPRHASELILLLRSSRRELSLREQCCPGGAFIPAPAWAEWVAYSKTADGDVYYYDPATIKKRSHFRRVWSLHDLKRRGLQGELSALFFGEYDCKEERLRIMSMRYYSARMADGKLLRANNYSRLHPDGAWHDISPGTEDAAHLQIVCAK